MGEWAIFVQSTSIISRELIDVVLLQAAPQTRFVKLIYAEDRNRYSNENLKLFGFAVRSDIVRFLNDSDAELVCERATNVFRIRTVVIG